MSSGAQRTLLVAPTLEHAANLARSFDDVTVTTPAGLGTALDESPGTSCVVVTGVTDDQIAAIGVAVRESCPSGSSLIVDAAVAEAVAGLAGFRTESLTQLSGVLCVCLQVSEDATEHPALPPIRAVGPDFDRCRAAEAEVHVARAEAERRNRRIAELEADLAAREDTTDRPRARSAAPPRARSRRPAVVAAAAGVLTVASAVVLALLTDTGYDGALLTALVIVSIAHLLYTWRTNRRRASNDRRVRDTLKKIQAAEHAAQLHHELMRAVSAVDSEHRHLA